jgi:DnaK suppressor protein
MLTSLFIKQIQERLLLEKRDLLNKSDHNHDIDSHGDETDEVQANMLIDMHHQINIRNNAKLARIIDALRRIDDKRYGLCQDCGENIEEKRLLHNPYFTTCVSCAEQREIDSKRKRF